MRHTFIYLSTIVILLLACDEGKLEFPHFNNPSTEAILSSGDEATNALSGGFIAWYIANYRDVSAALYVASDQLTASWGNYGMLDLSGEPRSPIPNTESWGRKNVLEQPWNKNSEALSTATDIINIFEEKDLQYRGDKTDKEDIENNTYGVIAAAYLLRGLAHGYLSMLFDKAYLFTNEGVDGTTEIELANSSIEPYTKIYQAAINDLDKAIEIAGKAEDFTLLSTFFNGLSNFDKDKFLRICNSYKARFTVQVARTQEDTDAVDWNKVITWTKAGIKENLTAVSVRGSWESFPLAVSGNSSNGWNESGARVDMRVLNMIDQSQPLFYPVDAANRIESEPDYFKIKTQDKRIEKYFDYKTGHAFNQTRGYFHNSHYIYVRWNNDETVTDHRTEGEQMILFAKLDNDLLLAEAYARTGNLAGALSILNDPVHPRQAIGKLPVIDNNASKEEILNAIFYERYLELMPVMSVGSGFYDRRRTDDLQVGTFRHLPIPAKILNLLGREFYTFGGKQDPTGLVSHYNIETEVIRKDDSSLPTFN